MGRLSSRPINGNTADNREDSKMKFNVRIAARRVGAIGAMGTVQRAYEIDSSDRESVPVLAIKRAYQDGDIEHVTVTRIAAVAHEIDGNDLELYAITTGAFYETHKLLAPEPLGTWMQHVAQTVLRCYCREVEPVTAATATIATVAAALKAYYLQHVSEF
jgi:hypothetical protein